MAFSGSRAAFVGAFTLLLFVSAGTLALQASTLQYVTLGDVSFGFTLNPYDPKKQRLIFELPAYIYMTPLRLAIAAGVISVVASLAGLIFAACAWPHGNSKRTSRFLPSGGILLALCVQAVIAIAAMILLFVQHYGSAHFDAGYWETYGDEAPGGIYNKGVFDAESWFCDMAAQDAGEESHALMAKQCGVSTAARWMLVPLVVAGLAGVAVSAWTFRRARALARRRSLTHRSKEIDWF